MPVVINGTTGITSPGETVTGNLTVNQSTGGFLTTDGAAQTNIQLNTTTAGSKNWRMTNEGNAGRLRFLGTDGTNTVFPMYFYNNGQVTLPAQPAFKVAKTGANPSIPVGFYQSFVFDAKTGNNGCFDVGNNFNTGNGTFTAPVAGKYLFTISYIIQTQSGRAGAGFLCSGNEIASFMYYSGSDTGVTCTAIVDMAANDTCIARISNVTAGAFTVNLDPRFTYFAGYLLG